MQVGSLVECIKPIVDNPWVNIKKGDIFTVRSFTLHKNLEFEEIPTPIKCDCGIIVGFDPAYFRELQKPMSITIEQFIIEPLKLECV